VQSIPLIKFPLEVIFLTPKTINPVRLDFCPKTQIFPELGKFSQALGMRAIDFPHKNMDMQKFSSILSNANRK
jgi:hypothetical protein